MSDMWRVLLITTAAAVASPVGGLLALWRQPTSLFVSASLGFASGILLGAISFEMLPQALELFSLAGAVGGFATGFLAVYGFDLFVHRGRLAGSGAQQRPRVQRYYHFKRPRGGDVTVLAGGTSAEELIEGLSIGAGFAIQPSVGLLVALAIIIDNVSEALSIGELVRDEHRPREARRVLGWTGLIGAALLVSSVAGWFLLRGLDPPILGFLLAAGGGGMFYLTVTDLVPKAEEKHYQQSGALAIGLGFVVILVLSRFT